MIIMESPSDNDNSDNNNHHHHSGSAQVVQIAAQRSCEGAHLLLIQVSGGDSNSTPHKLQGLIDCLLARPFD